LLDEHRDGSGQLYRRNRYYDPQSGRFTQEDPIGIAGGLNLYGFADGDPVSYSDPYGLYIIVRGGSQEYRQRVLARLRYVAERSETFREIYNAFTRKGVDVVFGPNMIRDCPGSDYCTRRNGPRRANVQFPDAADPDEGFIGAHEMVHAAALVRRRSGVSTETVPNECGSRISTVRERCAQDVEEIIRREVRQSEERERARRKSSNDASE
jgi:RHS repeat-associated protein